jgi:P4 family phage/plasmid primase-like protien
VEGPHAPELLAALYSRIPAGYRVLLRSLPGGIDRTVDPAAPQLPAVSLEAGQHFFGVVPRGPGGVIDLATDVWLDRDDQSEPPPWFPVPTATVLSGGQGKVHAYWRLAEPTPVDRAVRLCRLARIAYSGDPAVCESKRIMRLPGYYNQKYNPPAMCALASLDPAVEYRLADLEERLLAAVIIRYWEDGNRHQLALALGATLARVEWDAGRVEAAVRHVCALTDDPQVSDRVIAAVGTLHRKDDGAQVSASALREAMADEYRALLQALGVTARDGDVLVAGVRVASVRNIERDVALHVLEEGGWAASEGQPARWTGTHWAGSTDTALAGRIMWALLARAVYVKDGLEYDLEATSKLAAATGRSVMGRLENAPLEPPPPLDLPLENGVLDLTDPATARLRPHHPDNRNTWVLPVSYDRRARAPRWLAFMREAVEPPERLLLQEWLGYLLTAGNPHESMLWLWGPPETGKSTFIHAVDCLLRPTSAAVRLAALNQYSLAALADKRVAFCTEMPSRELRTDTLKALVSSDQVEARHPYGRPFNLRFSGKIVWATNNLPDLDEAEGLWRRLTLVRFERPPAVSDPQLKRAIAAELPGVLNWALGGLRRLQRRGWSRPPSVAAAKEQYRDAADEFGQFGADCLWVTGDPEDRIASGDLYRVYTAWAEDHGFRPRSHGPAFFEALRRLGCEWVPKPVRIGKRVTRAWARVKLTETEF